MFPTLLEELGQIPAELRGMLSDYQSTQGKRRLDLLPPPEGVVFTGMGASYHAAWVAAQHLSRLGIPAWAVEAVDLLNYAHPAVQGKPTVVYISQSGASGEVLPLLDMLAGRARLVALTNKLTSPLARAASQLLPMCAGEEFWVAGKTYVNSLAILHLVVMAWTRRLDEDTFITLAEIANRLDAVLAGRERLQERLLAWLGGVQSLTFIGQGPHAATARNAAMMMGEWAKQPALSFGAGAFRHGFIETAGPGMGYILFVPKGSTAGSVLGLAVELAGYGANVLLLENGGLRALDEAAPGPVLGDEFLSPLVDMLPVQLFSEALARERQVPNGFRYIHKVVTDL
jgi:glutamine---fructose-6-phosphate transaminase (isomerizing)